MPFANDLVLTGIPRSGTTLACSLLNQLPDSVALVEPMLVEQFKREQSPAQWRSKIRRFFAEQRQSLMQDGTAMARTASDGVDDNTFASEKGRGGLRASLIERRQIKIEKPLSEDFILTLKHPNAFTAMLTELVESFRCFALVRDPLSVLASWNTLPIALREGHAPAAESLVQQLSLDLRTCDDRVDRQLRLLSWYFEVYRRCLPREQVLHYETLIASEGRALASLVRSAESLARPLQSRNMNPLYDPDLMATLRERLFSSEGAYWDFYRREDYAG